jgi:hypothetical protein
MTDLRDEVETLLKVSLQRMITCEDTDRDCIGVPAQPTSEEVEKARLAANKAAKEFATWMVAVIDGSPDAGIEYRNDLNYWIRRDAVTLAIDRLAALARTVAPADDDEPVVKPKGGGA